MSKSAEKIGKAVSDIKPAFPVISKEDNNEKRKNVFIDGPRQIKNSDGR